MIESERASGGADGLMLRVDGSRFKPRRRRRLLLWLALGLVVLIAALLGVLAPRGATTIEIWSGAEAAPTSCRYSGGGPPFSVESFEAAESRQLYLNTLRLAASNELFPSDEDFRLPTLSVGVDRVEVPSQAIPLQVLYAIAWEESKIAQAAYEVDWGTLGPVKLSFDCGYGIMQITSSINNDGGLPSRYEALVTTHFAYNIAAGARILAEKWNESFYPIVGAHDPSYVESWYYALWAYNGWAGINHPEDPRKHPGRGIYGCDGERREQFTYQERVLGCVINPPMPAGRRLWEPLAISLPNLAELTGDGMPLDLDVFYSGLNAMYVEIDASGPFAEMNMPLPAGSQARPAGTDTSAAATRAQILGQPAARLDERTLEITSSELASGDVPLLIHNDGSGLLAWRVVDAPSWLETNVSAGVALGNGYGYAPAPSRLRISAAAGGVPEGSHRGRIRLEFHYPDGSAEVREVAISLDKRGAAFYEAGRPQS